MKGETSKRAVIKYYTSDAHGIERIKKFDRDRFIKMIEGIKRDCLYVRPVSTYLPPQNHSGRKIDEGYFLLIPYWMSLSGVTFLLVASSNLYYRKRDKNITVSYTYSNLYYDLKEVPLDDAALWIWSEYKSDLLKSIFEGDKVSVSRETIDYDENYKFPIKNKERKNKI